jgi:single-strand DNA-binding protein
MVNKVILLGRVGKDPEVRRMDNNMIVAQFTLATSERWTGKDGNRTEHTEWHTVVVWRGLAEIVEKYVKKGSQLYVEGRLRSRSYDDKDGNKRYTVEIVADSLNLVGPRPETAANPTPAQVQQSQPQQYQQTAETTFDEADDSDMPF